jgi:hypothetical protein
MILFSFRTKCFSHFYIIPILNSNYANYGDTLPNPHFYDQGNGAPIPFAPWREPTHARSRTNASQVRLMPRRKGAKNFIDKFRFVPYVISTRQRSLSAGQRAAKGDRKNEYQRHYVANAPRGAAHD